MKILIVNTYDRGGAATACKRLHLSLRNSGIDSRVLLRNKWEAWPFSFLFEQKFTQISIIQRIKNRVKNLFEGIGYDHEEWKKKAKNKFLDSRDHRLEMFSFPNSKFDITACELYQEADIINLHWVAEFLDLESFFKINTKPVVWTLHDMNAFTGGEHFTETMVGMDEYGEPIKRKLTKQEIRLEKRTFLQKKRILSRAKNLTIVAPSRWLAKTAIKSEVLKGKPVLHIPNGIDPEIFLLKNKEQSRQKFNLPKEKTIVLFVADSVRKNRKGYAFLEKAFKELNQENVLLCTVGNIDSGSGIEKNINHLGPLLEEDTMCDIYNAADVLVVPSLIDNLPNTVMEAIVCGTPAIGFPVGGIKDMIENGKNGYLTNNISASSLAATLKRFLAEEGKFNRENIRNNAIGKYHHSNQAKRYIRLFQDVYNK